MLPTVNNRRESSLYGPILDLFGKTYHTFAEVPFGRRSVDLVFAHSDFNEITAVEVKISNWRQALRQAAINQLFADRSFVAIDDGSTASRVPQAVEASFRDLGVGLIIVGTDIRIAIEAEYSNSIVSRHRSAVLKVLASATKKKTIARGELENGETAESRRSAAFLPAGTH